MVLKLMEMVALKFNLRHKLPSDEFHKLMEMAVLKFEA